MWEGVSVPLLGSRKIIRHLNQTKANTFSKEVTLREMGRGVFTLVGKEQSVTVLNSAKINYSEIILATCNYFFNNVFVNTEIVWE